MASVGGNLPPIALYTPSLPIWVSKKDGSLYHAKEMKGRKSESALAAATATAVTSATNVADMVTMLDSKITFYRKFMIHSYFFSALELRNLDPKTLSNDLIGVINSVADIADMFRV